jgi:hypothetical protein
VQDGATLYVSHDNGMLSPFTEPFGIDVLSRTRAVSTTRVTFDALPDQPAIQSQGAFRLELAPTRAEVLAREGDGNPVFTRARYGKGSTYFLSFPMEKELTTTPGSFHSPSAQPAWQVWQYVAQDVLQRRVARKDHPMVGLTEHPLDANHRVLVAINYSPQPVQTRLSTAPGWHTGHMWNGTPPSPGNGGLVCSITANDALVMELLRADK